MIRTLAAIIATLIMALVMTCSNSPLAGNSSEIPNGYAVGTLTTAAGTPAVDTRVLLLPADYNPVTGTRPPDSLADTTDDAGRYLLRTPKPGTYSIEATALQTNEKALITGITIALRDTATAQPAAIQRPGIIRMVFPSVEHDTSAYVYLPGTTCFAPVIDGEAIIEAVPAGSISAIHFTSTLDSAKNRVIPTDLTVTPDSTAQITDSRQFSKRIYLNTTAAGADISGDVHRFPVLVRLSSDNFDFSQAKADGGDVRFSKPDENSLPHEIERWDAAGSSAEIWVRVDTIRGNDSAQFFVMSWGDSSAPSLSNSSAVFDTANGFAGVWHMAGDYPEKETDATPNRYDGEAHNITRAPGMIGLARQFDGQTSHVRMKGTAESRLNFGSHEKFTVSAWVYVAATDTSTQFIAGKGQRQYDLLMKFVDIGSFKYTLRNYVDHVGWNTTGAPASAGGWALVVGVRDEDQQRLYVNGALKSLEIRNTPFANVADRSDDFTIGMRIVGQEGRRFFNGLIDEVRISGTARSDDWIRLCYGNQKTPDALVKIR